MEIKMFFIKVRTYKLVKMGLIVHVRPVGHHSLINTRVERGKT